MDKAKTVLLTGATGFLGSYLLEALVLRGYQVIILKRSFSDSRRIDHLLDQVVIYDIDLQPLELAFKQQVIDVLIHTACHYGRDDDSQYQVIESNLVYALRLLDVCLKFNVDTFINTDTLLQKKLNAYTLSKKQFVEWLARSSDKIQIINLKLEHIYGPKDDKKKFVSWVLSQLKSNASQIALTLGEQHRDFVYVEDVVSAYIKVLACAPKLPRFNQFDVGTGQTITVKSFVERMKQSYEKVFGASNTELNFGSVDYRENEPMRVELNNQPLLDLGWIPYTSLEKGLINIIEESR